MKKMVHVFHFFLDILYSTKKIKLNKISSSQEMLLAFKNVVIAFSKKCEVQTDRLTDKVIPRGAPHLQIIKAKIYLYDQ